MGKQAVELARAAGLSYDVAINLHNQGEALFRLDQLPRAYASFQQSLALCEETAQDRVGTHNRAFLAYLDARNGVANADTTLREAIAYAAARGYSWDEVNGRYLLGRLHRERDEPKLALAELERCRALARSVGFRLVADDSERAIGELSSS